MTDRIAIVDPGSFILPYDFQLVKALAERGQGVDFYGSTTRYNGEFLEAMRALPGVVVRARAISSTVTSRWRGAVAYVMQLATLLWHARRYDTVNLQFSGFWPVEWLVLALLRRQFVFTVHNAVPHGFAQLQHGPTLRLARLARALVFVSDATRDDFMHRYGDAFRAKSSVLQHGLLPVVPQACVVPYTAHAPLRSLVFWSTVKPYKGVELFGELAQSEAVRQRGLSLAVYGAWAAELQGLRQELAGRGVAIHDGYLDPAQLLGLLGQDAVFLLPYQRASQSGAMYALLSHGRLFICSDVGDLGAFMRRHGLEGLLLKDRSAASVVKCLAFLDAHRSAVAEAFNRAQQALRWDRLLAEAGQAYGAR
ncbi:MAG: glycosyltransferase [Rhizobacter sp.]|nr:glycosyltransferase [Rhizobacter sp.]